MGSIEVSGATLEYLERGSGEPVVFIHGGASDHRTWQGQLGPFADRFRAISYSRRYHWPNERIADGSSYALSEQVDDLDMLLHALDAPEAHLVGHSYGGLVALGFAIRAPERVRSLVLMEPPVMTLFVSIPPRPAEILALALRSPRTAVGIVKLGALGLGRAAAAFERGDSEAAMKRMGTAILGRQAFDVLSEERASQVRDNLIKEESSSRDFLPRLDADELRRLRVPVLIAEGTQSPRVFARLNDHLETILPNTERVRIPNASHLMHEDNGPIFNRVVLEFISAHESPQSAG
jgi:pimeloyl-ACP methyl ester carboxylesterase